MHCSVIALDELNKTQDHEVVLQTFSDLVLLYDKSKYSCHETAHHLGMWLYGYTSDLQESLGYAKQLCGGAVFHGILQGYFLLQQLHNVDAKQIDITQLCPQSQNNPHSIIRWQCLHGIGHGLAEIYNYNITAAVNRCNEFEPGLEQLSCTKGVFMQNEVHYEETGQGNFNKNDLLFPCDAISIQFAPACYHYHATYILQQNDNHLIKSFDTCDKIYPAEFAKYCYHGIGRQISPVIYDDPQKAISDCYFGKQSSYHADCLKGMLMTIINRDYNMDIGFAFCSISHQDFKDECYNSMGQWIKMLYTTEQEWGMECSKANDPNYIGICRNANLDNIDLL